MMEKNSIRSNLYSWSGINFQNIFFTSSSVTSLSKERPRQLTGWLKWQLVMVFNGPFELRWREEEQNRVDLTQNQFIFSHHYFTPLHFPSFQTSHKSIWLKQKQYIFLSLRLYLGTKSCTYIEFPSTCYESSFFSIVQ